jgi:hypothetical protein
VKDQPREVTAQEDAVLRRAVLRSGKVIAPVMNADTRAYIASLVAERDELRQALMDLMATRNAFVGMKELVLSGTFADTEARASAIDAARKALE